MTTVVTTTHYIVPKEFMNVRFHCDIQTEMAVNFGFPNHYCSFDNPHVLLENGIYSFPSLEDYYYHGIMIIVLFLLSISWVQTPKTIYDQHSDKYTNILRFN